MPFQISTIDKVLTEIYVHIDKGGDVSPLLTLLEMRLSKFTALTKRTTKTIW